MSLPAAFSPIQRLLRRIGAMKAALRGDGLLQALRQPGPHELALHRHFAGRMRFDGSAPVFARPLVLVAFTNRSGSNLVCDYLLQTGRIAVAGEFLNEDLVRARGTAGSLPDYIRQLHDEKVPAGAALALKASWDQIAMLTRGNILAMFPGVTLLHCQRNDMLAQAVSYSIALHSGRWHSRQTGQPVTAADVPQGEVEQQMEAFNRANLLIRLICAAHGLTRWDIGYERLCLDKGAHLAQVLRREGLAAPGWMPGQSRLDRQADALNAALSADFLAQVRQATR